MTPLFKTHFSIGKSILTLEGDDKDRSIFKIAKDKGLKDIVLVEDSLIGFLEARKQCAKYNFNLIFGLRISVSELAHSSDGCTHKVVVFAKDSEGCKKINII